MVYCGKPSKACAECRAKRTKCDMRRPACSQCIRTGRLCSGYRDQLSLAFRDQTAEVMHQQEGRILHRRTSPSFKMAFSRSKSPTEHATNVIWPSPVQPVEDYATAFFFTNWVIKPGSLEVRGQLDCITDIANETVLKPPLANAISALGMASLAHFQKEPRLVVGSRARYNIALRSINAALRDPTQTKDDQTLLAVLIMGMYEGYTCGTPRSLDAWTKHVEGATALLHLRGVEQLENPIGYQMFCQLRGQVIINCLHANRPIPKHVAEWTEYSTPFHSEFEQYNNKLITILLKFTSYWYDIQATQEWHNVKEHMAEGLAIDAELVSWAANAPLDYHYKPVKSDDERAYKGMFHAYPSLLAANSWNAYRSIRIILLQIIVGGINHLTRRGDDISDVVGVASNNRTQLMFSKAALHQLMMDTCRSVPYLMDWRLNGEPQNLCPKSTSAGLLIWPLYTAALIKVPRVDNIETSTFAIKCLREIAQETGHKQAAAMAHVLSIQKELSDWQEADIVDLEELDLVPELD